MTELQKVYVYFPETGILLRDGKEVGTPSTYGYLVVRNKGVNYAVHRLAWEFNFGKIPKGMVIDHINRDVTDNRLSNLRLATKSENAMNSKVRSDNTTGCKGVSWCSKRKKYRAFLNVNGKQKHLGSYKNIDDAILVRKKEEALVSDFF